jgi:hypothetical protein
LYIHLHLEKPGSSRASKILKIGYGCTITQKNLQEQTQLKSPIVLGTSPAASKLESLASLKEPNEVSEIVHITHIEFNIPREISIFKSTTTPKPQQWVCPPILAFVCKWRSRISVWSFSGRKTDDSGFHIERLVEIRTEILTLRSKSYRKYELRRACLITG